MRKYGRLLLIMLLAASMLFVGCEKKPADEPVENEQHDNDHDEEDIELALWEGEWNSVSAFMDEEEVKEALEEAAKEDGKTVEETTKEKFAGIESDHAAMIVKGDKVTFLDGIIGDGKEVEAAEYEFKESRPIEHGGKTYYWHVFESKGDGPKYLMLMEVHGEQHLAHFHMRYGDDIEKLEAREDWYPTFVRPNASMDLIAEEIAE